MKKTALIGMSGGVDSSVAAFLTQQQGYACGGCTMLSLPYEEQLKKKQKMSLPKDFWKCILLMWVRQTVLL